MGVLQRPCCTPTALGWHQEQLSTSAGSGSPRKDAASAGGAALSASAAACESAGAPTGPAHTRGSGCAQHLALAAGPDGVPAGPERARDSGGAAQPGMPDAGAQRLRALERRVRSLEQSLGAAHPQAQPRAARSFNLAAL